MRAGIYVRVSSEEQIDGTSLTTQRERCQAFCDAKGWDVVDIYADEGVSGAKTSRPALDRLMTAVAQGRIDAVVVYKTDRFSRSRGHLFSTLDQLSSAGVTFSSVTEPFDTSTTHGDAMVGMLGVFAQMERNIIRERTRSGVNARVRGGGWGGGHLAPFGYRIVGQDADAHLEIDTHEAETVRQAVALILDHGLSTLEAAKRLNALGLTPRSAPLWTAANLRQRLKNGQWGGTWTFGKSSPKGSVPEPITVAVEPILSPQRFAALQAYLQGTKLQRYTRHVHPLSGRITCQCGQHMTGIARSDRAIRRYQCAHAQQVPGRPHCKEPSLDAQQIDDAVWWQVLDLLTEPDRLMAVARERLGMLEGAQDVEAGAMKRADDAVQRAQQALATAATRCLSLGLDDATTAATLAQLQENHAAATRQRDLVAAMSVQTQQAASRMRSAQALASVARERLVDADDALRAKVIALLDVRVRVLENTRKPHHQKGSATVELTGSVAHELLLADVMTPSEPPRTRGWHRG